jgi:hypothetical protein
VNFNFIILEGMREMMKLHEKSKKIKNVLDHLFNGQELEIEICKGLKQKIVMRNNKLKITSIEPYNQPKLKVDLTCDISLNQFIELCNKVV